MNQVYTHHNHFSCMRGSGEAPVLWSSYLSACNILNKKINQNDQFVINPTTILTNKFITEKVMLLYTPVGYKFISRKSSNSSPIDLIGFKKANRPTLSGPLPPCGPICGPAQLEGPNVGRTWAASITASEKDGPLTFCAVGRMWAGGYIVYTAHSTHPPLGGGRWWAGTTSLTCSEFIFLKDKPILGVKHGR